MFQMLTNKINHIRLKIARRLSHFFLSHYFKGGLFLRKHLCRLLIPPANGRVKTSLLSGLNILLNPAVDDLDKYIYYFGEYESGTLEILKKILHQGHVFLDVGANIGYISLTAAKFVGEKGLVYAIEPNPDTWEILKENINLNKYKNIYSFNLALGSKEFETQIFTNSRNRGLTTLFPQYNVRDKLDIQIKVSTIDVLIDSGQVKTPALIKIDVEGYELEVLKGATKLLSSPQAPALCIEFSRMHPMFGGDVLDIYYFIRNVNNYSIFKLKRGKGIPSKLVRILKESDLPYHDNIFCFLNENNLK